MRCAHFYATAQREFGYRQTIGYPSQSIRGAVMIRRILVYGALVVGVALPAGATPLTWNLDVTFNDGTTASGSFNFDADTGLYSAVSISLSTGVSFDTTEVEAGSVAGELDLIDGLGAADLTGNTFASFVFTPPLSDLGGTVMVPFGGYGPCIDGACLVASLTSFVPGNNPGSASATPVPEPTTLLLFGVGAGSVGVRRWRKLRGAAASA
jgi:hypothetical protein